MGDSLYPLRVLTAEERRKELENSNPGGVISDNPKEVPLSPAEPQQADSNTPQEDDGEITDREEEDVKEEDGKEDEEEEEVSRSAHLEPSTLPWPGDKDKMPQTEDEDETGSENRASEPEERDTGISAGSQDLSEDQAESDMKSKDKWRESMPEGERWRDDEIEVQRHDKGDGSLADDEHEEEEEEEEEEEDTKWRSEKAALGFTPNVTIVRPSSKEPAEESRLLIEREEKQEEPMEADLRGQYQPEWIEDDDKYYKCEHLCSEKLRLALATAAAAVIFPLLVWAGYAFLPFDPPLVQGPPLRVVYTLRCSFFASIPILLGVVVQGVARLRYSALSPLYQSKLVHKEVAVHWHFISESLALFLFYFLQLAVMATYISQDLIKLVPLLTIIFVFGRLIYWLCLSLGSTVRGLGFGLSFLPILVMLGANLYYICSSVGQGAVFDVAPPTTAPPPRQRWWG